MDEDRELSVTEVMQRLRLSRTVVVRMIDSGQLPARRLTPQPKSPYRVLESAVTALQARLVVKKEAE